jgi:hypothetical protein
MTNGTYISPTLRRAYAAIYYELDFNHNPFDSEGILKKFIKQNYLLQKNNEVYHTMGTSNIASHNSKFIIVNKILRLILKIIGPNAFSNFSRLLVYLSSYRQNRSLWKF